MSGNLHLNNIKVTVKNVNNDIDEVYNIMFYGLFILLKLIYAL